MAATNSNGFEMTGTTISFASGFLAEIIDVSGPEPSREAIDVSSFRSATASSTNQGWKDFIPAALTDGGELSVTILFNPADTPPVTSASEPEEITIAYTDAASTSWSFWGFMTTGSISGTIDDKATMDVTIKITGTVTF